jgi:hypothetical protein
MRGRGSERIGGSPLILRSGTPMFVEKGFPVWSSDSPPLDAPRVIGGPGSVTIYLNSTRPEIELTATRFEGSAYPSIDPAVLLGDVVLFSSLVEV